METNSIGQNIKALREKASLTHEELAEKLNIPTSVLIDWEVDYGGPNGDQMMHLVDIFNVSYNELAGRVNKTSWSLKDGLIMGFLTFGVFLFFQPIYKGGEASLNLIQLTLGMFKSNNGSFLMGLSSLFVGLCFLTLLVGMFLSRQNPKRYLYHGNSTIALVSVLLLIFTGILAVLLNTYGDITIITWILLLCAAMPLFFYYGYRKPEMED